MLVGNDEKLARAIVACGVLEESTWNPSRLRYYLQLFGRQRTPPVRSSQRAPLVVQLPLARSLSALLISDA